MKTLLIAGACGIAAFWAAGFYRFTHGCTRDQILTDACQIYALSDLIKALIGLAVFAVVFVFVWWLTRPLQVPKPPD